MARKAAANGNGRRLATHQSLNGVIRSRVIQEHRLCGTLEPWVWDAQPASRRSPRELAA